MRRRARECRKENDVSKACHRRDLFALRLTIGVRARENDSDAYFVNDKSRYRPSCFLHYKRE